VTLQGVTPESSVFTGLFFYDRKYSMKFKLLSLIDITETGARRGEDKFKWHQQNNYMMVLQTIGLRANPIPVSIDKKTGSIGNLGFGSKYKGKNAYWEFEFDIEHEDAVSLEMLENDFDLMPILSGLEETISLDKSVFRTKDSAHKNIIFEQIDK